MTLRHGSLAPPDLTAGSASCSVVDRRSVVLGLAAVLAGPITGAAQPPGKAVRIGRLSPARPETDAPFLDAFRKGLHELGWIEGQHFVVESGFAEGKPDRLPHLAADLVRRGVDVILAGSNPGALAAKRATTSIPIVMVTTADPVEGGVVPSLARPAGNVTGLTALGHVLNAKRLEALKAAVPNLSRVAVLVNPLSPYTAPFLKERETIARELRMQLRVLEARGPDGLEPAFATIAGERIDALMLLTDIMFITHRRAIVALAGRHRVPAVYGEREFVEAGGLMFYGASLVDMYRRAAVYVDRIVNGARPADLPIEQLTRFELVVNLKSARAIGLTIPPTFLMRADQLIE
jgi:ABC-type uncharacterized transport system substrate-binding protein